MLATHELRQALAKLVMDLVNLISHTSTLYHASWYSGTPHQPLASMLPTLARGMSLAVTRQGGLHSIWHIAWVITKDFVTL